MRKRMPTRDLVAVISLVIGASGAMAATPPPNDHTAPSRETRARMAKFHERMAACLRSNKPLAECRAEMMKNFRDVMGENGCPMMGSGMGMGHTMQDEAAAPADHGAGDHGSGDHK